METQTTASPTETPQQQTPMVLSVGKWNKELPSGVVGEILPSKLFVRDRMFEKHTSDELAAYMRQHDLVDTHTAFKNAIIRECPKGAITKSWRSDKIVALCEKHSAAFKTKDTDVFFCTRVMTNGPRKVKHRWIEYSSVPGYRPAERYHMPVMRGARARSDTPTAYIQSTASAKNPTEIGKVTWMRDFSNALEMAKESNKPVFALFQEVPGCSGCKRFGREVLSHPLMVEAIERYFVPVVVYNNTEGDADREVLCRYGEPAWNYQVVRFLDSEGMDVIPRQDRVWDVATLAQRMVTTLYTVETNPPLYLLSLTVHERTGEDIGTLAFAMPCFWTGEAKLGRIGGVLTTEAGWMDGREVVKVQFDQNRITFTELIAAAAAVDCAQVVYSPREDDIGVEVTHGLNTHRVKEMKAYRKAEMGDQKRQLKGTKYKGLDLSPMQATKINAFVRSDSSAAERWLSETQKTHLMASS